MQESKLPQYIPFAQIPEYTKDIVIDGIDPYQEQLLVNPKTIQDFGRRVGLGHISIQSETGEARKMSYHGHMVMPGVFTVHPVPTQERQPLARAEITFIAGATKPDAIIYMNQTEVEERIKEDAVTGRDTPSDSRIRAQYVDQAIKQGLLEVSLKTNIAHASSLIDAVYLHGVANMPGPPRVLYFYYIAYDFAGRSIVRLAQQTRRVFTGGYEQTENHNEPSLIELFHQSRDVAAKFTKSLVASRILMAKTVVKAQ